MRAGLDHPHGRRRHADLGAGVIHGFRDVELEHRVAQAFEQIHRRAGRVSAGKDQIRIQGQYFFRHPVVSGHTFGKLRDGRHDFIGGQEGDRCDVRTGRKTERQEITADVDGYDALRRRNRIAEQSDGQNCGAAAHGIHQFRSVFTRTPANTPMPGDCADHTSS
jgi:hypothetical protein